jgi:hypothetical protein
MPRFIASDLEVIILEVGLQLAKKTAIRSNDNIDFNGFFLNE